MRTSADLTAALRRRELFVVAVLTALALGLRMTGVGFLLPHKIEPDGHVLEDEYRLLESGDPQFKRPNPDGLYPQLLPRIATLAPSIASEEKSDRARSLDEHRSRAASVRRGLRVMTALFSVLVVPLTWMLARRFLSAPWALCAAAFTAVSVLHIWFTQEMRPHGPAGVLLLASVLAALRVRERPTLGALAAAGLVAALAVACLQYGVAAYAPILAAVVLRDRGEREKPATLVLGAAIALVLLALAVALFYPFLFEPVEDGRLTLEGSHFFLSGHVVRLAHFNGSGFWALLRAAWSYEPLLVVLSSIGACLALAHFRRHTRSIDPRRFDERAREITIVLAFVLPFTFVIGVYEFSYQRFLIPLLPFAALLAAFALERTVRAIGASGARPKLARAALILFLALPLGAETFAAIRLVEVRAARDTVTQAADWIEANTRAAQDRILVLPCVDLPLFQTERALAANRPMLHHYVQFPWFAYLESLAPSHRTGPDFDLIAMPMKSDTDTKRARLDPKSYLADLHGDYAVIEGGFEGWGRPQFIAIRAELMRSAELAASFSPDVEGYWGAEAFEFQETEYRPWLSWIWRAIRARSTGPLIEIYKLAS